MTTTRTSWATLLAAAVVGLTCGSVTAVVRPGPGPQPAAATRDDTAVAKPGRLLYLDGDTLHDGEEVVTVQHDFGGEVQRLVRARDGWVLAEHVGTTEPGYRLWHVRPDGTTTAVAEEFGPWDLDPGGTRVVGADTSTGDLRVWTLGGRVVADAGLVSEERAPMWAGPDTVLVSALTGDEGSWRLWRWPMGRAPRLSTDGGLEDVTASRDGDLLVGDGAQGGVASAAGANTCLTVVPPPGVRLERATQTCDWVPMAGTRAVVSPGGDLVLAMPSDTDGFGPSAVATFSARDGVRSDYAELALPPRSLGAQWLDDDHLVVTVASDLELDDGTGTELQVCPRRGGPEDCEVVASRVPGRLLAGEQY